MAGYHTILILSVLTVKTVFAGPAVITPAPLVRRDDQAFIGWTDAGVVGTVTDCKLKHVDLDC
jgi:hypothetical protein